MKHIPSQIWRLLFCTVFIAGCAAHSATFIQETPFFFARLQSEETPIVLPQQYSLSVPFSAQAPYDNWNDPYQEACEEMSVIMLDYYLRLQPLNQALADEEILKLIDWESNREYKESVSMKQLSEIIEQYYGYTTRIIKDVSVRSIKEEIATGNPVIVPAAGRLLNNPNFRGGGPLYHMLVITGYDQDSFITNDPGTAAGEEYVYPHRVLLSAIHDWTGAPENILEGGKVMLTVDRSDELY